MSGRRNSPKEYRVNDQRPYLRVTFLREDENGDEQPEDLSTVLGITAKGRNVDTPETLKFTHTMAPYDTENGVFEIQWVSGDLDTVGLYEIEYEIEWFAGVYETSYQISYVRVKEQFS